MNLLNRTTRTETLNRPTVSDVWKEAWGDQVTRLHWLLSALAALFLMAIATDFFIFIDARSGRALNDPFLQWLPNRDVSWLTFYTLYASVIAAGYFLVYHPKALLISVQSYLLVTFMRLAAIYLVPLEPPIGIIPLQDPFISLFAQGKPVYKDLFFSGHTGTACILYLTARQGWYKWVLLAATGLIGFLALVQHVHYTVDVVAAPFFAWLSYWIVRRIHS